MAEGLLTAVTVALALAMGMTVLTFATGPGGPARSVRSALQRNREVVSLAAFGATAVVVSISAFSLGPLLVVAGLGASAAAVAWLPAIAPSPTGDISDDAPDAPA